jgi:hypothetical protein
LFDPEPHLFEARTICLTWLEENFPDVYDNCLKASFDLAYKGYLFNRNITPTRGNPTEHERKLLKQTLDYYQDQVKQHVGHAIWLMKNKGTDEVKIALEHFSNPDWNTHDQESN